MIITETYLGKIALTDEYIKEVVSKTVSECFGVAGMKYKSPKEFLFSRILGLNVPGMGVDIKIIDNKVRVILHITAAYGTNIAAVVASIKNKVRFALTETVGVEVHSVCVNVDDIKI